MDTRHLRVRLQLPRNPERRVRLPSHAERERLHPAAGQPARERVRLGPNPRAATLHPLEQLCIVGRDRAEQDVEWPPRYLVTLSSTAHAPISIGRVRTGEEKVLSATQRTPWAAQIARDGAEIGYAQVRVGRRLQPDERGAGNGPLCQFEVREIDEIDRDPALRQCVPCIDEKAVVGVLRKDQPVARPELVKQRHHRRGARIQDQRSARTLDVRDRPLEDLIRRDIGARIGRIQPPASVAGR